MAMSMDRMIEALARDVGEGRARRVIVGLNWTLVEGPSGCGLSQTPARGTAGCSSVPGAGGYNGRPLEQLAQLAGAGNPVESAIGFAAIAAHFNRFDLQGEAVNGLDAFGDIAGPVTAIGRFPDLATRIPGLRIVEREPREGEFGEADAPRLLGESEAVIITASALGNGSLAGLLAAAKGARIALVGPSAPLAPCLHDFGIGIIAGLIVEDVEGAARAVAEAGAVRALKPHCRMLSLFSG